ncbi:hypothetical protein K0M31_007655 [Melipona bicolor]|uniref:Uncharacterized protein n=1 Tax=Melipona bicolor TaxID=60889 RepID=A0AA40GBU0_9HYME|nr:hypothetical protein K0M31_007655 [Melipona bicolor]
MLAILRILRKNNPVQSQPRYPRFTLSNKLSSTARCTTIRRILRKGNSFKSVQIRVILAYCDPRNSEKSRRIFAWRNFEFDFVQNFEDFLPVRTRTNGSTTVIFGSSRGQRRTPLGVPRRRLSQFLAIYEVEGEPSPLDQTRLRVPVIDLRIK